MKYITTKDGAIVIFSNGFTHSKVAHAIREKVIGAGFVNLNTMECYGKSVSLGIGMHKHDTRVLKISCGNYY